MSVSLSPHLRVRVFVRDGRMEFGYFVSDIDEPDTALKKIIKERTTFVDTRMFAIFESTKWHTICVI